MINTVGNNGNTATVQLGDSNKVNIQPDGPPVDRSLVNEIKTKVEQGRYPIDLDIVTEKMFESFREAGS
jgi:anti-sigma28 factor (negative regulator of flagellin synthesis)